MASIYVSPLYDYDANRMNGFWVDLEGKSFEEVHAEICDRLGSSPTASEEWVIHNYKDFMGIRLGETDNLARVVALAEALEEHGEAFAAFWAKHHGHWTTVQDALEDFEEAYMGCYNSLGDYARECILNTDYIPNYLVDYIDWEGMGQDFEKNGDIWTHEGNHGVHIFFQNI